MGREGWQNEEEVGAAHMRGYALQQARWERERWWNCLMGCLLIVLLGTGGCVAMMVVAVMNPVKVDPAPVPKPAIVKRTPKPKPKQVASVDDPAAAIPMPDAAMPVPAEPELINTAPPALPEFAIAKTRKAGDPLYVRAVWAGPVDRERMQAEAKRLRDEVATGASPFVVDWFKTAGPLAWSGAFAVSNSARVNWLGRVTITDDNAEWSAPMK